VNICSQKINLSQNPREQISLDLNSLKLQQVGAEINEKQKLQQHVAELGWV
jgi:hypothetical protein